MHLREEDYCLQFGGFSVIIFSESASVQCLEWAPHGCLCLRLLWEYSPAGVVVDHLE